MPKERYIGGVGAATKTDATGRASTFGDAGVRPACRSERHGLGGARDGGDRRGADGPCASWSYLHDVSPAVPPKEFCAACQQRAWEPVTLAGDGTIASYTVIRVAPRHHVSEVPYAIAVVKLREGVSLIGRIVDIPLDTLAIGLPVRFRPLVTDAQTSVGLGPA